MNSSSNEKLDKVIFKDLFLKDRLNSVGLDKEVKVISFPDNAIMDWLAALDEGLNKDIYVYKKSLFKKYFNDMNGNYKYSIYKINGNFNPIVFNKNNNKNIGFLLKGNYHLIRNSCDDKNKDLNNHKILKYINGFVIWVDYEYKSMLDKDIFISVKDFLKKDIALNNYKIEKNSDSDFFKFKHEFCFNI